MATKFSTRISYEVSAERLFELLTDTNFLERKALEFGADEAKVNRRVEPDGTLVVVTETKRPANWGSGQDHSVMTVRMDPDKLTGTWTHRQIGLEDRSTVEGRVEFIARGPNRCEHTNEGSLEIRVPLIGRRIEKKIKAGIEEGTQKEAVYIRRALRAAD